MLQQNNLFILQHVMHAITLTGIKYGVLSESEWEGRHAVKLSTIVPGVFIRKSDLETGFSDDGRQIKPLSVRITAEISAVDALLTRAGWSRESDSPAPLLHQLLACSREE